MELSAKTLEIKLNSIIEEFVHEWEDGYSYETKPIYLADLDLYHDVHDVEGGLTRALLKIKIASVAEISDYSFILEIDENVLKSSYASRMDEWTKDRESEKSGISLNTYYQRRRCGWSKEEAESTPNLGSGGAKKRKRFK